MLYCNDTRMFGVRMGLELNIRRAGNHGVVALNNQTHGKSPSMDSQLGRMRTLQMLLHLLYTKYTERPDLGFHTIQIKERIERTLFLAHGKALKCSR